MGNHLIVLSIQWELTNEYQKLFVSCNPTQGSTFPGAQGHMPLDFAVGP